MVTMPIYDKNPFKSSSPGPEGAYALGFSMLLLGFEAYKVVLIVVLD